MDVRAAIAGDELAVACVHVRAWQAGYRGLLPDAYLDALRAEDRAARYTFAAPDGPRTRVAWRDGVIVGFATASGSELSALYVDPAAWRAGIGRALTADAYSEMAAAGVGQARLWLLDGNTRGLSFYTHDGWTPSGARRDAVVWGRQVAELELSRPL